MSQDYVAIYRSMWSDDEDWRALSMSAQWMYKMLLTHPDRNAAGVLPLTLKKWTRLAAGLTVADLQRSLAELDGARFIVVDEDTEEVLVRSYIRRGKVFKHVRLFLNALKAVSEVESGRLKKALGYELWRLPKVIVPEPNGRNAVAVAEAEQAQRRLDDLASMLGDGPWDPPGQGADHPMGHGMPHPLPHPPGVGAGTGAGVGAGTALGSCSTSENESLESTARAKRRLSAVRNPTNPADRKALP